MRGDDLLIAEMITWADDAIDILGSRSPGDLEADEIRRDTILWNMTVLGEAASQVSDALNSGHPAVEWNPPTQMRNRIVHGYWSVDLDIIVATIRDKLPPLVATLRQMQDSRPG
jgi:uncharacterized protein with HEPN domain